ncbi:MAG: Arc family DNA-binding protein [Anaerolineae bacterium]|nr:Arc family DNA-binding protein [Anaerolineae bacterium]MCO5187481.1 Arc family DNA-binding protein [Anaerolineae bacterium]MCO5195910.1 Arc family DNA-binding protein [Anaerolineae bacterium]MCO5197135.1 Arc family DNA-binding protein [Anaerolineae bacterium]MCO5207131.1 Arc family DNA-binding protein [Anaerolineae bacterium]
MATLTIKNIPDDLYEAFKQVARKNHRSINSEVIYWLERAVEQRERDPEVILSNAQLVREALGIYTTNEEINAAIDEGRP